MSEKDHIGALENITEAGRPVTFSEDVRTYTPETGISSVSRVTVAGQAIRVQGSRKQYEILKLSPRDTISLLFAATLFKTFPAMGMKVTWGNITYIVRFVSRIAPDGDTIISRVVISK